jgi:hypothetical protein
MHTYEHAHTPYAHLIYSRFSIIQNFIILTYIIIVLKVLISAKVAKLALTTIYRHMHITQNVLHN